MHKVHGESPWGAARWEGGENSSKLKRTETELRQVQEMGEWMSDWLMQPADKWLK